MNSSLCNTYHCSLHENMIKKKREIQIGNDKETNTCLDNFKQ